MEQIGFSSLLCCGLAVDKSGFDETTWRAGGLAGLVPDGAGDGEEVGSRCGGGTLGWWRGAPSRPASATGGAVTRAGHMTGCKEQEGLGTTTYSTTYTTSQHQTLGLACATRLDELLSASHHLGREGRCRHTSEGNSVLVS